MARCGVTIVTGSLGAGKTRVVCSLAEQFGAERVSVVSNELTRLDHDAARFKRDGLRVVSLTGECASQRPGALADCIDRAVDLLGSGSSTGRVIVELAGTGTIEAMLGALESAGDDRWAVDGVVSVFDARTLLDDRLDVDPDPQGPGTLGPGALIESHIAASTAVILNFARGLPDDHIDESLRFVDRINPDAMIETSTDGQVRAGTVIDPVWAPPARRARASMQVPMHAVVFDARRPLHPGRLREAIEGGALLGGRSKGTAWLATQHETSTRWDHRGLDLDLSPGEAWWASTPPASWPADRTQWAEIFECWNEPWGDRRQMLTILGPSLDKASTLRALGACLLTDQELALGPVAWSRWGDALPATARLHLAA